MTEQARHEWVATQILPHEGRVRSWLRRQFQRPTPSDVDDLMQDAYLHLCDAEFTRITNAKAYLIAIIRNLLAEQARRARIVPMERLDEIEALRIPSEDPGPDRRAGAPRSSSSLCESSRAYRRRGKVPDPGAGRPFVRGQCSGCAFSRVS